MTLSLFSNVELEKKKTFRVTIEYDDYNGLTYKIRFAKEFLGCIKDMFNLMGLVRDINIEFDLPETRVDTDSPIHR